LADPIWGARSEWGVRVDPLVLVDETHPKKAIEKTLNPTWLTTSVGNEPKPPRPLAPSSAGEEQGADPPLAPEIAKDAARRGTLIHALLERLPDVEPGDRREAATNWLQRRAADLSDAMRAEMLESAIRVLDGSDFADIFSPDALAEVPLMAQVDGVVIAGTADRLLVTPDGVTVVDFKTTRRPPESADAIPKGTIKQMAAYAAALQVIYPGKAIKAAVLYTHAPALFEIPQEALGAHKRSLGHTQDKFVPLDIE